MIDVDKQLPPIGIVVKIKLWRSFIILASREKWNGNAWRWVMKDSKKTIRQGDVTHWQHKEKIDG